jgi:hypothetical protein
MSFVFRAASSMKLKNTGLFLLKRLLIMMKICWRKFMEDENSITEEEINKALRAMDMAIIL